MKKLKKRLRKLTNTTNICKICFCDIKIDSLLSFNSLNCICYKCFLSMEPIYHRFKINGIDSLAIFKYGERMKKLIYLFKGNKDYELKDIFLSNYLSILKRKYRGYLIVFAPSSKESDEKRGFNQVKEIFSNLKLEEGPIFYKTKNEKQSEKHYKDRQNVKKIIQVDKSENFYNKKFLIVDDICTTGSTLKAMIEQIKYFKPLDIKVLVIAKRMMSKEEAKKYELEDKILE